LRRSYDAKAWQWFSLGKTQLSSLHAMVAQRTTDADSPTAFAGGQIHVGSVSHRVTSHDPAAVLRFQQPACTASTRIFLCQQSGVPAQPHLLFAFLHALLWHQLRQPLSSMLTGLPTACQPLETDCRRTCSETCAKHEDQLHQAHHLLLLLLPVPLAEMLWMGNKIWVGKT